MLLTPFVADRQIALDAARLIDELGEEASSVASAEASLNRDRGNLVNFCRWRQVGHLIAVMNETEEEQTRH